MFETQHQLEFPGNKRVSTLYVLRKKKNVYYITFPKETCLKQYGTITSLQLIKKTRVPRRGSTKRQC